MNLDYRWSAHTHTCTHMHTYKCVGKGALVKILKTFQDNSDFSTSDIFNTVDNKNNISQTKKKKIHEVLCKRILFSNVTRLARVTWNLMYINGKEHSVSTKL